MQGHQRGQHSSSFSLYWCVSQHVCPVLILFFSHLTFFSHRKVFFFFFFANTVQCYLAANYPASCTVFVVFGAAARVMKSLLCVPLPLKTAGLPLPLTLQKRDFVSKSRH